MDLAPHPVKMIRSREEDFAQGAYRPALTTAMRGALGPDGRPTAWRSSTSTTPPSRAAIRRTPSPIWSPTSRSAPSPTPRTSASARRAAWPTRSTASTESFIDELAHAAGKDPFAYRRDLLPQGSRHRRVLETAAAKAGWGEPLPPGVGRGIALVESFGTIVAHVVEASAGPRGAPRVHRARPPSIAAPCATRHRRGPGRGAIVMGLGAAIAEEVTIEAGTVVQHSFPDYPLLTLAQTPPRIEVHFLESNGPWGGLGEPGLPPVAPALANADVRRHRPAPAHPPPRRSHATPRRRIGSLHLSSRSERCEPQASGASNRDLARFKARPATQGPDGLAFGSASGRVATRTGQFLCADRRASRGYACPAGPRTRAIGEVPVRASQCRVPG